ncbi:hypothetical protein MTR_3g114930 [Medicago truncatula]|uniref:Uncharacterized protein n=1 Tax=Medicago truncatula TaxID=3880 RepID=A0A072V358_MEDTR|nr:hypothetical protein MTR_3g114930 [Medicago truncatula]
MTNRFSYGNLPYSDGFWLSLKVKFLVAIQNTKKVWVEPKRVPGLAGGGIYVSGIEEYSSESEPRKHKCMSTLGKVAWKLY